MALMEPNVEKSVHPKGIGNIPFCIWDHQWACFLQAPSCDVISSSSCKNSLWCTDEQRTATAAGARCFSNQLLPPYWEPGDTCCVCHFLVIRQCLKASKISIPHLPFPGAESKCYNSCLCICFPWCR